MLEISEKVRPKNDRTFVKSARDTSMDTMAERVTNTSIIIALEPGHYLCLFMNWCRAFLIN